MLVGKIHLFEKAICLSSFGKSMKAQFFFMVFNDHVCGNDGKVVSGHSRE